MSYLEEVLPEFRNGAKIRMKDWSKGTFIIHRDGNIITGDNYEYPLSIRQTLSDQWEFYQEPDPDWSYIIKNKCLCWFWDDDRCKYIGYLQELLDKKFCGLIGFNLVSMKNCRPVRKNEVTFYEDKE